MIKFNDKDNNNNNGERRKHLTLLQSGKHGCWSCGAIASRLACNRCEVALHSIGCTAPVRHSKRHLRV